MGSLCDRLVRPLLAAAMGLAACLGPIGCETLRSIAADAPRPTADITSLRVTGLSLESASVEVGVRVANPYAVPLPVADMTYALSSGQATFLTGAAGAQGTIPARASRDFALPATIRFADLMQAVSGIRPGAMVPYAVDSVISLDTEALGRVEVPLKKEGELPVPAPPTVSVDSIEWGELTFSNASATVNLRLGNPNAFGVDVSRIAYGLSLGGTEVARTDLAHAATIAPGRDAVLRLPLSFSPRGAGAGLFNVLMGRGASYGVSGQLSVTTPFGPLTLPLSGGGETSFTR